MMHYDRVWVEIDLDAIVKNMTSIKNRIGKNVKVVAVIKTDGYGHGATQIARILETDEQVWGYAVATAEEAFSLRERDIRKPILILGYTFPYSYEQLIREDVRMAVFMDDVAQKLSERAVKLGIKCKVHVKVDTGMTRIGIRPDDEGLAFVDRLSKLPGIEIEGIFTHFATADEKDRTKTLKQYELFKMFTDKVENELKLHIPMKHCANSASIVEMPQMHMDAVRAGIILYGLWPSQFVEKDHPIDLYPVLSLKTRVVYVKTVPKDQEISYGGTFTTTRDTRVATVCIGYGDGYPRSLSNIGHVLIKGQKARILGRVCMDQLMVDVTDVKGEICVGDIVTLIGRDGEEEITMEELGELSGRFNYELACDLSKRIPRIYKIDDTLIND